MVGEEEGDSHDRRKAGRGRLGGGEGGRLQGQLSSCQGAPQRSAVTLLPHCLSKRDEHGSQSTPSQFGAVLGGQHGPGDGDPDGTVDH